MSQVPFETVEKHEAAAFMRFGDKRPYLPEHGPNSRPYNIRRMPVGKEH